MTVEVVVEGAAASAAEVQVTQAEAIAADAVETAAEASVQIAEIEAARDVELAEIAADTHIQAVGELQLTDRLVSTERELEECRTSIADLEARNSDLSLRNTELLSEVARLSIPPASATADPPNQPPEPAVAEVTLDNQGPAEEPAKPKRRAHRWI